MPKTESTVDMMEFPKKNATQKGVALTILCLTSRGVFTSKVMLALRSFN